MNWNEKDYQIVYIYVIKNKLDRIVYVGQTKDPNRRKKEHFDGKKCGNYILQKDIKNIGKDNFTFEIIDKCWYRHRYIVEAWWTRKYSKEYALYNIKHGQFHTGKEKQRLSELTSGVKNPMYGKSGIDAINGQTVYMLNDNWEIVKEFVSVKEAIKYLGLKGHTQLHNACKNSTKYKGYYWSKTWKNM